MVHRALRRADRMARQMRRNNFADILAENLEEAAAADTKLAEGRINKGERAAGAAACKSTQANRRAQSRTHGEGPRHNSTAQRVLHWALAVNRTRRVGRMIPTGRTLKRLGRDLATHTVPRGLHMVSHDRRRRLLLSGLALAPCAGLLQAPAAAQSDRALPPIVQPTERTKLGFLARARALREQAVKEGDQAYGAVVVRNGIIVGEGRNYVVLQSDPTAHAELLAVRDAARRLNTRDLSDCDVYSTATPCPMCQGALYWSRIRRFHTEATPENGIAPKLGC